MHPSYDELPKVEKYFKEKLGNIFGESIDENINLILSCLFFTINNHDIQDDSLNSIEIKRTVLLDIFIGNITDRIILEYKFWEIINNYRKPLTETEDTAEVNRIYEAVISTSHLLEGSILKSSGYRFYHIDKYTLLHYLDDVEEILSTGEMMYSGIWKIETENENTINDGKNIKRNRPTHRFTPQKALIYLIAYDIQKTLGNISDPQAIELAIKETGKDMDFNLNSWKNSYNFYKNANGDMFPDYLLKIIGDEINATKHQFKYVSLQKKKTDK